MLSVRRPIFGSAARRLESDGKLVGFARSLIQTWRWRDKVGDVDGSPNAFLGGRIVHFERELDLWVPQSVCRTVQTLAE